MLSSILAVLLAGGPTPGADETVQARIEERLRKANLEEQAQVAITVEDGRAVLCGTASSLYAAREAERLAAKEARSVDSRIRVEPEPRSDAQIAGDVREAVLGYVHYTVFDDVEGRVQEGRVFLDGSVHQPYRKEDIESRVARVPGVREIHDQIRVQSSSIQDEDLRKHLYRTIYGGALQGRGGVVNPPVHIVVDGGRVTLTGYVSSPAEKALVETLARQAPAFAVDSRLRVEGQSEDTVPSS